MIFAAKLRKNPHPRNTLRAFETIIKQKETYGAKFQKEEFTSNRRIITSDSRQSIG
jgi:hypothetical protein